MRISTILGLLSILFFFTACGGGGSEKSPATSAQFLTASFAPATTDVPIAIEKIVTVTFSGTIDSSTVDDTSVYIEDANSTHIPAAITVSAEKVTLIPTDYFLVSSHYTLVVTTAVKDIDGHRLEEEFTFAFTTAAAPDTSAPSLLFVTPADGTSADKATEIIMAFDEEIANGAAALEVSFTGTNTVISGTSTITNNIISLVPDTELSPEEEYTVTLLGSVEDLAGNAYTGVTSWDFSVNPLVDTIAPSLFSVTPADGTAADKATEIIMAFDEVIADNAAALVVRDSGSALVSGTSTIDNNTLSFVPNSDLTPGEDYTVTLQNSVSDPTGNTYTGVTSWAFFVNPLVDTIAPRWLSFTPADGASVDRATDIVMEFDETIENGVVLKLTNSDNSANVTGISLVSDNTLRFVPDSELLPATNYTVTVQGPVNDLSGNTYTGVTSWDFSTDPITGTNLTVTHIKLKNGKVNIEFYERLDASSVTESDLLINDGAIGFTGFKVTPDKWQIEFVPDTALVGDENFTISGNVKDTLGNIHNGGIDRDYSAGGILSVWDVKQQGNKVNVKFWEIPGPQEVLDPTTIDASDFQIDGGAITFSDLVIKDYQVTFTADTPLSGDEVITISGDIQDKAGNFHNDGIAVQHTFR